MRRAVRWTAVLLYAAAIFAVSSVPKLPSLTPSIPGLDKVAHSIEYFFFAATVLWALSSHGISPYVAAVTAAAIAALYAVGDEFHQVFVAGRQASLGDWFADACGAIALALIAIMLVRRRAGRPNPRCPLKEP